MKILSCTTTVMNMMLIVTTIGVSLVHAAPRANAATSTVTKTFYYSSQRDAQHSVIAQTHPGKKNQPWVITIHGGSWMNSDPSSVAYAANAFAARGYVSFNLGYPLYKKGVVTWKMQRDALNAQLAYIRSHAVGFGINPNRGAIYGFSAGGHLALMLGLTGDGTNGIKAIVSASGVAQPRRLADDAMGKRPDTEPSTPGFVSLYYVEKNMVGCENTFDDPVCNAAWADFSPENQISPRDPAVMMFAGTADTAVPHQSNGALAYWLKRQKVPAYYTYVNGMGHDYRVAFDGGARQTQMMNFIAARTR